MPPLLRLTQACFGYRGKPVVRDVDLEIQPGQFLGIVGPNGGGKSTLFKGCLGLIAPLAGRVERFTRRLGYVPQREHLDSIYPLRVDEVVHMGAYGRLRGWRGLSTEDRRLAQECLERVGLAPRTREQFSALSGGQRQRVLIARALMARPELLLLDEPTSGVDRGAQQQILELLLDLNRRERIAVLLVSHQLQMVREAVGEVLWVGGGRVQRGDASTLLDPAHLDRQYGSETADARTLED
jgi:ABC-type Mn2+/Zn2+ transport system ATPase subunit